MKEIRFDPSDQIRKAQQNFVIVFAIEEGACDAEEYIVE